MKKVFFITAVGFLAYGSSAFSADVRDGVKQCSAISGSVERLACFDRLSSDNGLASKISAVPVDGVGKWDVNERTNPLDDSRTVFLMLRSDSGSSGTYRKLPIGLVIRCKSNKTELFVNWNDYLGRSANVVSRIGSNPAKEMSWSMSSDSKATFKDRSISFIKEMLEADSLVLQTTPYNASPVTAEFDIRGLSEAIKPVRETCGW